MSDHPPTTSSSSSLVLLNHPLLLSPTATAAAAAAAAPPASFHPLQYRKGNWTLDETLILITAKKLDDDRRARSAAGDSKPPFKTPEHRWKWVENYCWAHGCRRSQNQCNDKWDNLLRDYKKVRDYQSIPCSSGPPNKDRPSYWEMEKQERKERNLPSNLLFQVFEALHDVFNQKNSQRSPAPRESTVLIASPLPPPPPPPPPPLSVPPPSPPPSLPTQQLPAPADVTVSSSETEDGSERRESDTKRRKLGRLGSSVVRGATELARTLLACEEKRDKRHQNVLELEERKLQIEETRTEINRQGLATLVTAVNNLSNAVHALVSDRTDTR